MPKVDVNAKNGKIRIRIKLKRGEMYDERDLQMMKQKQITGLLIPTVMKKNLLEYIGPQAISLSTFFSQPLSSYQFYLIMVQIFQMEQKLAVNGLNANNLITDFRYIYINQFTNELQLIYFPGNFENPKGSIRELATAISYTWQGSPYEDNRYARDFAAFIGQHPDYSTEQILAYIMQRDMRVAGRIQNTQPSGSGFITNKQADYIKHYENNQMPQTDLLPPDTPDTSLLNGDNASFGISGYDTALLEEENSGLPDGGYGTSLLDVADTDVLSEEYDTSLLDESGTGFMNEEEGTSLLNEEATGLLREPGDAFGYAEAGTELLDESNATMPIAVCVHRYPYLVRRATNERISINKPVFRIGKERSYVDFFISDNNAISRSHADIITRGKHFYVCDRNSTNKTYRNGYILTPEDEVEIFDGDMIQLANEEFEFHAE